MANFKTSRDMNGVAGKDHEHRVKREDKDTDTHVRLGDTGNDASGIRKKSKKSDKPRGNPKHGFSNISRHQMRENKHAKREREREKLANGTRGTRALWPHLLHPDY